MKINQPTTGIYLFIIFHYTSRTPSTKRKYNNYTKINAQKLQMEKLSVPFLLKDKQYAQ